MTSLDVTFSEIHPRVCGKYPSWLELRRRRLEPPPRVRETHLIQHLRDQIAGTTPARAGNTEKKSVLISLWKSHPCVCRKRTGLPPKCHVSRESPPRMRETQVELIGIMEDLGATPARAGIA